MKKMIALLLAMALCLGLFAGCGGEQTANTVLADAKAYLEAMYKQEEEITAVDYTRVGVVKIDGVTYPVTWTVDVESIKITAADKMVKIDLPDTLEDIPYTLTATVADAEGNTETVTFKRMVPAALGLPTSIEDGTYVILSGNLTMSSLGEDKGYGYPTATEVTVADGTVSGHKIADVLTIKNVDGGITIQDAYGRYFYLKGTYNSFNVSAEAPEAGHIWEVLKNGDNYLIVNAMNKKTLAYDSGYTSWGAYPELGATHNYLLAIVPATAPSEDPVEPPVENTDPAADSTLSIEAALALGASKEHNVYTEGKYYVTGVITEVYNETYGNMKIADANGNILTVYGTYSADGTVRYDALETKPVVGDTVTVYGIIGQFKDTPQLKNGWITKHTPAGSEPATPTLADAIAEANKLENKTYLSYESTITGTITDDPTSSDNNPGTYKFTVSDGTNSLLCYFVPVTGGVPVKGTTITVTGCLTAYNGTAQFDSKASAVIVSGGATETPTEPAPSEPAVSIECHLVEGKGYKLTANNSNGALWFCGGETSGRFNASAKEADAVLVYVEKVDGGFKMYTTDGTTKTYICMDDKAAGAVFTNDAAAATVYEWNAEFGTLAVAEDSNNRALGTDPAKNYENFSSYDITNGAKYDWVSFVEAK